MERIPAGVLCSMALLERTPTGVMARKGSSVRVQQRAYLSDLRLQPMRGWLARRPGHLLTLSHNSPASPPGWYVLTPTL